MQIPGLDALVLVAVLRVVDRGDARVLLHELRGRAALERGVVAVRRDSALLERNLAVLFHGEL